MLDLTLCKMKFTCDRTWDDLEIIASEPAVRRCLRCAEHVFHCSNYEEARHHMTKGHCVALFIGTPEQAEVELGELDWLDSE